MILPPDKDPMGHAMLDYLKGEHDENITVKSDISENDLIPVNYLFRSFGQMPEIEQKALLLCKGRILDIGAGSGSHSLHLQKKGHDVTALDISENACSCCRQRGVKRVVNTDIMGYTPEKKFDTLLLMMNGIGFTGTIDGLDTFMKKAKHLLSPGGQILLDSSDISYMFEDEDEVIKDIYHSPDEPYYGEVTYVMEYNNISGHPFKWLFIDPALLKVKAEKNDYNFKLLHRGKNQDYLARLTSRY